MSLKTPEEESGTPVPAVDPKTESKEEAEETNSSGCEHNMETVKADYDQLCCELNMDESTMETAWKSYIAIRHNYTLEVNLQKRRGKKTNN